jgi:hypothetical protein
MKKLLPAFLVLYTTVAFAQTTTEKSSKDSVFRKQVLLESYETLPNPFQESTRFKTSTLSGMLSRAMLSPSYELKTPTINLPPLTYIHFPHLSLDDRFYNQYSINRRSWINTSMSSTNYYGLGGVYTVGANINRKLGEFGVLTGGVYASKYNNYNNFSNSTGVNGNFKIILTDRISINAFGQYSTGGNTTGIAPYLSTLYPTSFYGGSLEFKVTDKWGIITGASNEFDVFSRKWVTRPFIMPIFYKH